MTVLRFPPPARVWSVNERLHWATESKLAAAWRTAAFLAARSQLPAGTTFGASVVTVELPFARRSAKRDPHNYTGTVVKRIIDGLGPEITTWRNGQPSHHLGAGLWPDDGPEWVTVADPVLVVGAGEVVVRIEPR